MRLHLVELLVGRAPQGARGLKFRKNPLEGKQAKRRAPQGARGLKCKWIDAYMRQNSRAPQGARGLKFPGRRALDREAGRAPQGARGLKLVSLPSSGGSLASRPARGARIEIGQPAQLWRQLGVAPRKGRED